MKKIIVTLFAGLTATVFYAQTVTGSGASGQVTYFTGATTVTGNNNLFTNGTSLGVGTNTLTFRLNVTTNANNDGIRVLQTSTSSAALRLDNSSARSYGILSTGTANSQGAGKLLFYDYSTTVTGSRERMVLDGAGNFGIGVNSIYSYTPKTRLHVHDGSIKLSGADQTGYGSPNIIYGGTPSSAPDGEWAIEYNSNLYGYAGLNFWRPNNSHNGSGGTQITQNNILFLSNDNRVGVRTNNPTADLTVHGNMLIGDPATVTLPGTYGLYVENGILTSKVKVATVNSTNWADYVFQPGYRLRPLSEVNTFISTNGHLPDVPSAAEVQKNGVDLLEMNITLLQKVEELTLYILQQEERIKALESHSTTGH